MILVWRRTTWRTMQKKKRVTFEFREENVIIKLLKSFPKNIRKVYKVSTSTCNKLKKMWEPYPILKFKSLMRVQSESRSIKQIFKYWNSNKILQKWTLILVDNSKNMELIIIIFFITAKDTKENSLKINEMAMVGSNGKIERYMNK